MIKIYDCMKHNVISISSQDTIGEAARRFVQHHIGLLPVTDSSGRVIGVLGMRDLLELALPAFVFLMETIDFVQDFGVAETRIPEIALLAEPVIKRMRPATVVNQNSGLLRAYAFMLEHKLHDLPVVDDHGILVGIASRVDIGAAILVTWEAKA